MSLFLCDCYGNSGFNQTKHMLPRLLTNVKYRRQPLSIHVYIGIPEIIDAVLIETI